MTKFNESELAEQIVKLTEGAYTLKEAEQAVSQELNCQINCNFRDREEVENELTIGYFERHLVSCSNCGSFHVKCHTMSMSLEFDPNPEEVCVCDKCKTTTNEHESTLSKRMQITAKRLLEFEANDLRDFFEELQIDKSESDTSIYDLDTVDLVHEIITKFMKQNGKSWFSLIDEVIKLYSE